MVWLKILLNSLTLSAVKQMLLSKGDTKQIEVVQKEIEILEKLRHPHIVHFLGCRMEVASNSVEFFLFMELYEKPCSLQGVLQKRLQRSEKRKTREWFTYSEVKKILQQISAGLLYLHQQGIAHRDLKVITVITSTYQTGRKYFGSN